MARRRSHSVSRFRSRSRSGSSPWSYSRRRALRLLATAGCAGSIAGCLGGGDLDEYALIGDELELPPVGRPFFWPDPLDIDATTRVDFTTERKRRYVAELFETGSVTVQQWPLVGRDRWGTETRPRPTFLRQDGSFYEVTIAEETIRRLERWHLAVERVEEAPADAAVIEGPPFDLSEPDRRVLGTALDAVYAGNDGFLGDPEFDDLRTVEYHHGLDSEASELVPSPPFGFVRYETDTYRIITDRRRVDVPEWTYAVEAIAETRRGFDEYASERIVGDELIGADLSADARDVLEAAVSEEPGQRYEEGSPPSEALSAVLEALGIAADLRPIDAYDGRVDFRNVVTEYDGSPHRFDLIVTP